MPVEDRWHFAGTRKRTSDYGRGKRWRVRNPGAPTKSFDTKGPAEKYDVETRARLQKGLAPYDPKAGNMPFRVYAVDTWLKSQGYANEADTVLSRLTNHAFPTFGNKRLRDISVSLIKEWWADMRAKKQPNGRPYAPATLQAVASHVGSIFHAAHRSGRIAENPFELADITIPTRDPAVRDIWELDLTQRVLDAMPDRERPIGEVSAHCGHRANEALAVAREDLNRFRGEITVRHQVKRVGGRLVLAPPKRGKVRTVPMGNVIYRALTDHADTYGTVAMECTCHPGDVWSVLFTDERGRLINASDWSDGAWYPALAACDIRRTRMNGRHMLRHVWVSGLVAGGATINEVSKWCGHASIKTTIDIYSHLFDNSVERGRAIVDAMYPGRGAYPARTAESG